MVNVYCLSSKERFQKGGLVLLFMNQNIALLEIDNKTFAKI